MSSFSSAVNAAGFAGNLPIGFVLLGGRSFAEQSWLRQKRSVNCALVIEDEPVGQDSRLRFESFPEHIDESYSLAAYDELGGIRMPQPIVATYQGGNWDPFQLQLQFRAGENSDRVIDPFNSGESDFEAQLIEMERKVNWCMALAFPLERDLGATQARVLTEGIRRADSAIASKLSDVLSKIRKWDPPAVLVVLGNWKTIRGYVTNVNVQWLPPFDPGSARPMGATVMLTIKPLYAGYPTWQTIRNRAGRNTYTFLTPETRPDEVSGVSAAATERKKAAERKKAEAAAKAGVDPTSPLLFMR